MTRKELEMMIEALATQAYRAGLNPTKSSDANLERTEKRLVEILAKALGV